MKILIIDDVHPVLTEGLRALGHEADYRPLLTRAELVEAIGDYEGLVVRTKTQIDRDVLLKAGKLKFIARAGAGLDNIDTPLCSERGISCFNAGEANADAVGEQTVGMLLCLFANIIKADAEVRKLIWDREGNRGVELKGKTVGIIGYGNTGRAVAKKLSGFGVKVLAYDKYLHDYTDAYATQCEMERVFDEADVLTLHVPLTDETAHLVNAAFMQRFRKSIFLLNLSRGGVVDTEALVAAMRSGKLAGCALDVLENEKPGSLSGPEKTVFDFLKASQQVVLTPHIGGWTKESYEKISSVLLQKIKELSKEWVKQG